MNISGLGLRVSGAEALSAARMAALAAGAAGEAGTLLVGETSRRW
jgi:hypothetical protein